MQPLSMKGCTTGQPISYKCTQLDCDLICPARVKKEISSISFSIIFCDMGDPHRSRRRRRHSRSAIGGVDFAGEQSQ